MKKRCLLSTLVLTLLLGSIAHSQDLSNKGKDFWIPYPEHIDGTASAMGIYITSDVSTSGTISVGATSIPFTVTANTVTRKFIGPNAGGDAPNTTVHLGGIQDGIGAGKGIHVTAVKPVVVFAHIIRSARSGATLVLPSKVWGKEYIVPSFTNTGSSASFGELNIIASVPNTQVEITPSVVTRNGAHPAGVPFTVTIPTVGDVYQLQFQQNADLSGTKIKSIASATSGCNPIGVFSATTWSGFPCAGASGGDNLFQQLFPTGAWGKEFLTGPLKKVATNAGDNNVDYIKVFVKDPTTVVTKTENGVTTTLTGLILPGNYYQYTTPRPTFIQADKPVQVVQYVTSQTCGNPQTNSDPEMVVLSSVEQTINNITVFSAHQNFVPPGQSQVSNHYVNIIMKTNNTSSLRINGAVPNAVFTPIPATSYSYLKEDLTVRAATNPVFNITADSGFSAIAYGFGNVESYGYNAGTNVKDLYQQIGVQTEYGIEPTPSVCTGAPFKFKVSLPYCADSLKWDLTNLPGPPVPTNPIVRYTSCTPGPNGPDSTTVVNGKTIYWYSLPSIYSFNTTGSFPVTILAYAPNTDGCGTEQEINFDLQVSDPPVANFSWEPPTCVADAVAFTETTPQTPKPTYHFWWSFGDPASGANNTSNLRSPTHVFSAPGTYTVRFSDITTPGCLSDTIEHQITIAALPSATIAGTVTACINSPSPNITFTGAGGTAPYQFTYTINSGPSQTITTTSGNSVTIPVPTNTAGTFVYTLVSVRNPASAACTQTQTGSATVTITGDATINLTSGATSNNQTVCINVPINNITYAIAGGGTGGSVTGLPPGVTGNYSGGVFTISGTPTAAGVYNYTVNTTGVCNQTSANGTITVNANATINLTSAPSSNTQTVCVNTAITDITYAIGGGGTGASVTGLPAGVTGSFSGGVFTITGTPTVFGVFNYTVTTTGNCTQVTATGTITVNQNATINLTSGAGSNNQTKCINVAISPITYALGGAATGATVTGLPAGVTGVYSGGVFTISGTPTVTGTFNYTVTTNGSCGQTVENGTIIVNPNATLTLSSGTADQNVCVNNPIVDIVYNVGGGGSGVTVTGLPAGVTFNFSGGVLTITGAPTVNGVFNYTINTTGTCVQTSATGTITSASNAIISLTSASSTSNQTLCVNTPLTNITYSIGGSGSGGTVTGLPAGVNGVYSGGVFTISGTPTVSGVFNYTVNTTGNCLQGSANGTITVNDDASLTLTSAPATAAQELCKGVALTNITYAIGGGGTGATVTGLPAGITGTFSAGVFTISGTSTASGTFNYTVTTTGPCVQKTATGTIIINALPTGNFNYTSPSCATNTITFNDASVPNSGVLNSWNWDFGDAASGPDNVSSLQNPTHVFASPGNYVVTLSVTTDKGCSSTIFTRTVTVNVRPKAGFINPEICVTDPIATFVDTSRVTPGSIVAWNWNFGDPLATPGNPNTSTLQNPTHRYTATGPYTVRLIVTSSTGCKDTIDQVFTVNGSLPSAGFTVQNISTLCSNKDVKINDASSVDIGKVIKVVVYWDYLNDPTIKTIETNPVTGQEYTHNYGEFGTPFTKTYRIRYEAYSGINCVSVTVKDITVLATPTLAFDPIPYVCSGAPSFQVTQAQLLNGLPGPGGVYSGPGINASGLFNPTIAGIGSHTIRYTYTGTNGCSNYLEQTIDVFTTPPVNAGPDKFVLEGGQVTLTPAVNASMPVTYLWTPPTGLADPRVAMAVASPTDDITYTLTVTTDKGCKNSDKVFVKVLKAPLIPNIFSPNGDGVHDKWEIAFLESYPGCTIDIYNRYGQQIYHSEGYTKPWDGTVNGKPVPIGTYYYIVNPKNGRKQYSGYVDVIR